MILSVDGGGKDGDGITLQVKEKEGSTGADRELDWVSEFVQKRAEREIVNKLKVGKLKQSLLTRINKLQLV